MQTAALLIFFFYVSIGYVYSRGLKVVFLSDLGMGKLGIIL